MFFLSAVFILIMNNDFKIFRGYNRFPASSNEEMFEDIKEWGLYALTKLAEEKRLETMEKSAIVKRMWMHGDVAHHNFLRVDKTACRFDRFRPSCDRSERI